jgi:3-deoxy-D-manno-octulosonate 8-phosphate phosphatase (KDO 8-P phosphatase)
VISLPDALRERAKGVRALVLDVDGVFTDGSLVYGGDGEQLKTFHVKDGLGVRLLKSAGIEVGVISARRSAALVARLSDLKISHVSLGRHDKLAAFVELAFAMRVGPEEIAYAGDDLIDLPVLERVGLSIAPADAHPRVRARVHWITHERGGRGAVREMADDLLESQGQLDAVCDRLVAELSASPLPLAGGGHGEGTR